MDEYFMNDIQNPFSIDIGSAFIFGFFLASSGFIIKISICHYAL